VTLSSWNGSSRFTPAKIVAPRDPDELKAVVLDAVTYPSPLRALGELHSLMTVDANDLKSVLVRHLPDLGPALERVGSVFAPWPSR
jgi:hypothetical protein